jgi:hypothetical protein
VNKFKPIISYHLRLQSAGAALAPCINKIPTTPGDESIFYGRARLQSQKKDERGAGNIF